MSDKKELTSVEEKELDAVVDIMTANVIETNIGLFKAMMITFITMFLSGDTPALQPTIISTFIAGAHAYRKMLIESGVDVVELEKKFKPIVIK